MKKLDFKKINWKDPKIFFPLILVFPLLFMGYMFFGIAEDLSAPIDSADSTKQQEIADVPLGDSLAIISKADALLEAFKSERDFTALQLSNESTRISSDTTLYTEEEQALLALQEKEKEAAERDIEQENQKIRDQNNQLAEHRRNLASSESSSQNGQSNLDKEILMYQKILRGEEILTPEQEEERKLAKARKEEREKVLQEMNRKETSTVEKVSNISESTAFNTAVGKAQDQNNYIRAMVDQGVTVTVGSRIRFRLLDDIRIQGVTVPSGTQIYALVSDFSNQRVRAYVSSIVTKGKRVKVKLSVFDRDGIEGFFIPKSAFRDLTKDASSQALSQSNINFNNSSESIEGVALQTLQGVYQSASQAISSKLRENKAKIKYNTTIYLINDNE